MSVFEKIKTGLEEAIAYERGTLVVEGEKIEEAIATAKNQLGPDTKIVRCEAGIEVYK